MKPKFSILDIQSSIDKGTYKRSIGIYNSNKIVDHNHQGIFLEAKVQGTELYNVRVDLTDFTYSECNCYVANRDYICKHITAVALLALYDGKKLPKNVKKISNKPKSSNKYSKISQKDLNDLKSLITESMKFIQPYNGPSRTWFIYQSNLKKATLKLANIIETVPINDQTIKILVNLCIRLDRKLQNGVDDSNDIIGGFISDLVELIKLEAIKNKKFTKHFTKLITYSSVFEWEKILLEINDKK